MTIALTIDEGHPRNLVIVAVVLVLVAALDQLLLSFLQAKRTHQTLTIARYIDIRHIARIVYPRLSLHIDECILVLPVALRLVSRSWRQRLALVHKLLSSCALKCTLGSM